MSTAGALLYLLLVGLLVAGMLSIVFHTLRTGISPMPTSAKVRRQLLTLLPPELEGTLLELGSGWGTLAFALADHCPRARVVAFELSPLPLAFSRLRQRLAPRPNLQLVREDFFRASFSGASAVVCYLFPGAMLRLAPKLSEELAPGTRILSHTFALRGWKPLRTLVVDDLYRTPIYLYEVPPRHESTGPADKEPGR
ncbi:trans-aconitate 2-methyltransferase [Vitiosangium sp. GDMCC 1.1324]|uniref:class I SAM-dependent methyltransferase n=1 Tax=Vitiosangium sp. (strain GDMCC 1.1324) TaxID=2138576 RepID=UPI000D3BD130|nr:class I SAM-dependent methyltransferase [Vitiosangium sp. GDMCC 1.1324]PTL78130.1 SAM-dependent methyltransferase [Vitiosangium sp. GDMCC 1.1324]